MAQALGSLHLWENRMVAESRLQPGPSPVLEVIWGDGKSCSSSLCPFFPCKSVTMPLKQSSEKEIKNDADGILILSFVF